MMLKRLIDRLTGARPAAVESVQTSLPKEVDLTLKAYDLSLDPSVDPSHSAVAGWCFGLPRGIDPAQWPLDPASGYPLQHGFTLKLPSHFQVHGPDIVAISFFGTAFDHNDGYPLETPGLDGIIDNPADQPPHDPALRALWAQGKSAHKRLHRMVDINGCHYAVIPLTAAEFQGRPCPLPDTVDNSHLEQTDRPKWLEIGSAAQLFETISAQSQLFPIENEYRYKFIGGQPEPRIDFSIPIILRPRATDLNAGRSPQDTDWVRPVTPDHQVAEWAKNLGRCHLGGTMFPQQKTPTMSQYYLEFEEYFGNFNFGTGNAQLDLKTFLFSWDC